MACDATVGGTDTGAAAGRWGVKGRDGGDRQPDWFLCRAGRRGDSLGWDGSHGLWGYATRNPRLGCGWTTEKEKDYTHVYCIRHGRAHQRHHYGVIKRP